MSPDAIERSPSTEEFFNWRTLQRTLEHARAWQPGAFRLFERLQNDFLSGAPEILLSPWRMDISLDSTCYDGSGSLLSLSTIKHLMQPTYESKFVPGENLNRLTTDLNSLHAPSSQSD